MDHLQVYVVYLISNKSNILKKLSHSAAKTVLAGLDSPLDLWLTRLSRALKNSIISALQIHGKSVLRLPQYACFRIQLPLFLTDEIFLTVIKRKIQRHWGADASWMPRSLQTKTDTQTTEQSQKQYWQNGEKNPTQICIFERVWRCEDNPRLISFHLRKLIWRKYPNCHNKYKSCTFKCNRCTCLERRESTQIDQKIFWGSIKLSQNSSLRFYILNTVNFYDLNFSF